MRQQTETEKNINFPLKDSNLRPSDFTIWIFFKISRWWVMTYRRYIKDHPAYYWNHQYRKFNERNEITSVKKEPRTEKKKPYPSDQVKRQIKYQCWHVNKHTRPWGSLFIFPRGIYETAEFLIPVLCASLVYMKYYTIIYGLAYCIQTQQTILELKETES